MADTKYWSVVNLVTSKVGFPPLCDLQYTVSKVSK